MKSALRHQAARGRGWGAANFPWRPAPRSFCFQQLHCYSGHWNPEEPWTLTGKWSLLEGRTWEPTAMALSPRGPCAGSTFARKGETDAQPFGPNTQKLPRKQNKSKAKMTTCTHKNRPGSELCIRCVQHPALRVLLANNRAVKKAPIRMIVSVELFERVLCLPSPEGTAPWPSCPHYLISATGCKSLYLWTVYCVPDTFLRSLWGQINSIPTTILKE